MPEGKDVSDYLDLGHSIDELKELIDKAEPLDKQGVLQWRAGFRLEVQVSSQLDSSYSANPENDFRRDHQWPAPLSLEAFTGLAGDFTKLVSQETEADEAALLFQFLVVAGCYMGRNSYYTVGGTYHYPNLSSVVVGQSAKARKGTAFAEVERVFNQADALWMSRRATGLSTGEGLLWAIRDPIIENVPLKNGKEVTGYKQETTDPGIPDKRLLVVQAEFGQALQTMSRPGNTLSAFIRLAWDGSPLNILTKNAKASCLKPHIGIIGHITGPELSELLTSNDSMNGFANRFLWVCSKRSKYLPFGGNVDERDLGRIAQRIRDARMSADIPGNVTFSPDARAAWEEVYPQLSEGELGVLGAVTGRSEAQVLRLAMLYTLLESSRRISLTNLKAALAVWQYSADSAKYIFGQSLGNTTASEIRTLLRENPNGLTRTQIVDHFNRHRTKDQITQALTILRGQDLASVKSEKTAGRPVETWSSKELQTKTIQPVA